MELVDLSFILAVARKEEKNHGRQLCVTPNRHTYVKFLNQLRDEGTLNMSWGNTFEYYGHIVAWSSALNMYPSGYVVGAIWKGGNYEG